MFALLPLFYINEDEQQYENNDNTTDLLSDPQVQ